MRFLAKNLISQNMLLNPFLQIKYGILFPMRLELGKELFSGFGAVERARLDAVLVHPALGEHITGAIPAAGSTLLVAVGGSAGHNDFGGIL